MLADALKLLPLRIVNLFDGTMFQARAIHEPLEDVSFASFESSILSAAVVAHDQAKRPKPLQSLWGLPIQRQR